MTGFRSRKDGTHYPVGGGKASYPRNSEYDDKSKTFPVKTIPANEYERYGLDKFPNFHKSGSIRGMKEQYYGKNALLVRCGNYIYNVSSDPSIYEQAH